MSVQLIKKKLIPLIFSHIPISFLCGLSDTNFIIPYYHMISDDEVSHVKHLYEYKNITQFKDDLEFLLKKFSPINLFDLLDFLKTGRSLPKRSFLLTFDDGFREMHDIVAPILSEKGISATFFISSAFIDNKQLCFEHKASVLIEYLHNTVLSTDIRKQITKISGENNTDFKNVTTFLLSIKYDKQNIIDEIAQLVNLNFNDYLLKNKPYLTVDQINKLISDGFTIGAHGIDHPTYSHLTLEEQLYQTVKSVKCIREKFSLEYGAFAFPYNDNDISKKFFSGLFDKKIVDISFGTAGIIDDSVSTNIQRFSCEKPIISAKRIIARQFARKIYNLIKGSGKIMRV